MESTPRVLVVTYDIVGPRMAGPGIRAWEFARALAAHCPTTLAAPAPVPASAPGFAVAEISGDFRVLHRLRALIDAADVVITQLLPLHVLTGGALDGKYVVVDLYCPWVLENLARGDAAANGDDPWLQRDLRHIEALLARGDFFICASERQRDYWLGALVQAGRLTQAVDAAGTSGRALIDTVPFGLPAAPPDHTRPVLKGVWPGIGRDDFVALWGGGLWDWLDPLTLVRATERLRAAGYPIRTFFLGTERPHASQSPAAPPAMVGRTRALSDRLELTGTHVFFNEGWTPYAERANYLLEADIGVSLHAETLETRYAFRTRLLDYLWAGLVPVAGAGDTLADTIAGADAGRTVATGDDAGLAETIASLIAAPEERERLASNGRALGATLTWEQVTRPLVDYCRTPWRGETVAGMGTLGLIDGAQEAIGYAERLEEVVAVKEAHIAELEHYIARLEQNVAQLEAASHTPSITGAIRARLPGKRSA
jgi:glycosyltransferase involved in cell wall biosynthesis